MDQQHPHTPCRTRSRMSKRKGMRQQRGDDDATAACVIDDVATLKGSLSLLLLEGHNALPLPLCSISANTHETGEFPFFSTSILPSSEAASHSQKHSHIRRPSQRRCPYPSIHHICKQEDRRRRRRHRSMGENGGASSAEMDCSISTEKWSKFLHSTG